MKAGILIDSWQLRLSLGATFSRFRSFFTMTKSSFLLLLAVFAFPAAAQENQPKRNGSGNLAKSKAEFQAAVEIRSDIDYVGNDNPRQKLDLFLPKGRAADAEPLPLVVFIHGGGWAEGDKRSGLFRLREFLLTKKYAAASIGYRLSDEAQWPSQIHDCKAAIRWLRANAGDLGIDPDRMAAWGTSAGGHLVAMLGVSHGVEVLEGDLGPHPNVSSEVACVVNFFGPSELLTMNDHPSIMDHMAPDSPESKLVGGPILENPNKAKNASPVTWVSSDDEPSLIVHGTDDKLVPYPQSVVLEKALEKAGVPTVLLTVKGGGHGQGFGPAVNEAVTTFLNHQLLGEEKTISDGEVDAAPFTPRR